jgi:hypothetical protein
VLRKKVACFFALVSSMILSSASWAQAPSPVSAQPISVLSTDLLRRYVSDLARRHNIAPPDGSVMTRQELGVFFVKLMQQIAQLPPAQLSDQDFQDIGILQKDFEETLDAMRGRATLMAYRSEAQPAPAQLKEVTNRLAMLERVKVSGDFTYAPQADFGRNIHNGMSANLRGRLNFTTKVFDAEEGKTLGDGLLFMRLTAGSGRFFPRNKYLMTPENGLVDSVINPFNSGVNEVQIPNLQINNNNSNSVRPTVSLEQAYYSQDLRFGKKWKGVYRLGLQNFSNYFDSNNFANNETTQFLNSSFINSVSWRPNFIGPSTMAGVERSLFHEKAFLRATAGVISLASRDYWGAWGGNYEAQFGHRFFNKEGNIRAGFWNFNFRGGSRVPYLTPVDFSPSGLISIMPGMYPDGRAPAKQSDPAGFYLNFDQKIWKNIGVWARYGLNDKQIGDVYLGGLLSSRQSWSTGVEIPVGSFFKRRPDDVIGIAYGQISPYNRDFTITPASPAFVNLNGVPVGNLAQSNANLLAMNPGARRSANEKVLETYYRFHLNKNISISPDVQYYWNPGGTSPQPHIFVFGTRLNVAF